MQEHEAAERNRDPERACSVVGDLLRPDREPWHTTFREVNVCTRIRIPNPDSVFVGVTHIPLYHPWTVLPSPVQLRKGKVSSYGGVESILKNLSGVGTEPGFGILKPKRLPESRLRKRWKDPVSKCRLFVLPGLKPTNIFIECNVLRARILGNGLNVNVCRTECDVLPRGRSV